MDINQIKDLLIDELWDNSSELENLAKDDMGPLELTDEDFAKLKRHGIVPYIDNCQFISRRLYLLSSAGFKTEVNLLDFMNRHDLTQYESRVNEAIDEIINEQPGLELIEDTNKNDRFCRSLVGELSSDDLYVYLNATEEQVREIFLMVDPDNEDPANGVYLGLADGTLEYGPFPDGESADQFLADKDLRQSHQIWEV